MKHSCPDLLLPEMAAHTRCHQLFKRRDKGAGGRGRVASAQLVLQCRGRIRAELPGTPSKVWGAEAL